ncbi:hypothetical protein PIROE2DRAFT_42280, partial [Piromyces sp. E2]
DKKIFNNIKSVYSTCMNEKNINKKGKEPLMNLLKKINLSENKSSFEGIDGLTNLIILIHNYRVDSFFELYIDNDLENPDINIIGLSQPDLSLSKENYKDEEMVSQYRATIEETLDLLYDGQQDKVKNAEIANSIIEFEQKLSNFTVSAEELNDISKIYNKSNFGKLMNDYPNINWNLYFSKIFSMSGAETTINDNVLIINENPKYLDSLNKIIVETDINTLLTYIEWSIIINNLGNIATSVKQPMKDFSKIINEESPRYKDCVSVTEKLMGNAVGRYFIEKTFNGNSKTSAEEVIGYIKEAMINRIPKMTWLDDTTKEYAIKKVEMMSNKIGYPDFIMQPKQLAKKYEGFDIDLDDYFNIFTNYKIFSVKENTKNLDKPVQKGVWFMTPQTVNAYYYTSDNSINFPAGILQPPFFNAKEPDYLNYGGIGMVVGHELTHAFDSTGSQFDASGKYFNWWTEDSYKEYSNLAMCFVDQYNQYTIKDSEGNDVNANGMLTINENLADNGALSRAYEAWILSSKNVEKFTERNKALPGLSDYTLDQLFYIAFGQSWCEKFRPEYLVELVTKDLHSVPKHRVNGVVSNNEHFAKTFNCPKNSPMNPEKKCKIW